MIGASVQTRRCGITCKQSAFHLLDYKANTLNRPQLQCKNLMDHQAKGAAVRVRLCTPYRGGDRWLLLVAPHSVEPKTHLYIWKRWGVISWVVVQQIIFTGIVGSKGRVIHTCVLQLPSLMAKPSATTLHTLVLQLCLHSTRGPFK